MLPYLRWVYDVTYNIIQQVKRYVYIFKIPTKDFANSHQAGDVAQWEGAPKHFLTTIFNFCYWFLASRRGGILLESDEKSLCESENIKQN